ncbi:hypothetical protein NQ314_003624 [Rhamnusium bicolor]|uniref:Mesoderm induction early response protein 1 n=1 Tax=Rhamnusium bicolor TaxID=1586634 RepID=A0AAV8ZLJ2_9CUCU|nr:hypothetical protein NQ314_003624 [Rhamnusium bicolor]
MEEFVISPVSDKNENDDSTNEDKLSDSSVDTLANDFDEEIRLEEEDSTSGDDFEISDSQISRMKKKDGMYSYLGENQENENPRENPHHSEMTRNKRHGTGQPTKHSKLRALYDSASEKYQDASRLLRSKVNEEEEDNYSYNPDDDENRMIIKTIMVGSDYQAQVPDGLCHYDDALPYENDDKLIWDPNVINSVAVEDYLKKAAAISRPLIPMGIHLRDNEQALYLLQQCGHNVEEALRRLRMNVALYNENMSPWSEEECRNFEAGVRAFGKNFYLTQQNKVRTRSVGELVQFYYLWKKSERHDVFANKVRLEKKKYTLHPGVTDFMDRFLEDHDVRDRSSSPNAQCVIIDERKVPENQTLKLKLNK